MAEVRVVGVEPRRLAAVRRVVKRGEVSRELIGGLDVVWAFIRARSIPFGHNVALYSGLPDGRLEVECGVEVMAPFEPAGEVRAIETPSGTAARATHVGPVERIGETYGEIDRFVRGLPAGAAGRSWEVYGESTDDPSAFEIDIYVLLTERPAPEAAPA